MVKKYSILIIFFSFFLTFYAGTNYGLAAKLKKNSIYSAIGKNDALLVTYRGKKILEKNTSKKLIPASTLKLITSLMCIKYLGKDYRYKTYFYTDKNRNLIIKGTGDPLITSEILKGIAAGIVKNLKNKSINDIIIDNSFFKLTKIPGISSEIDQPYNAPVAAVSLNFNSINFLSSKNGSLISPEKETPLIPYSIQKIKKSGYNNGRIILNANECPLYFGNMLKYFLEKKNVEIKGSIIKNSMDNYSTRHLFTFISPYSLAEIIAKLLTFSNNFIANQIFLTSGAYRFKAPATLNKSLKAMKIFLNKKGIDKEVKIFEGSGISRKNRVTAIAMDKILTLFEPHRFLMKRSDTSLYKTGTLDGISTRAGYMKINNKLYHFVILLNTAKKQSKDIEKKIIDFLK